MLCWKHYIVKNRVYCLIKSETNEIWDRNYTSVPLKSRLQRIIHAARAKDLCKSVVVPSSFTSSFRVSLRAHHVLTAIENVVSTRISLIGKRGVVLKTFRVIFIPQPCQEYKICVWTCRSYEIIISLNFRIAICWFLRRMLSAKILAKILANTICKFGIHV